MTAWVAVLTVWVLVLTLTRAGNDVSAKQFDVLKSRVTALENFVRHRW